MLYLLTPLFTVLGPVSLLSMWTNRITTVNSRKHQEFFGRASSVNNKFELYQHLKDENGCVPFFFCSRVYITALPAGFRSY